VARPNALQRNAIQQGRGGFDRGLNVFQKKLAAFDADLLPELGALMHQSITVGSRLTGAPGQPVDQGDLLHSWSVSFPSATSVQVSSDSPYARPNEDGVRGGGKPYIQRSPRGGRHSVRLTRRGLDKLVEQAAKNVSRKVAA
jgi:hypothetical protein